LPFEFAYPRVIRGAVPLRRRMSVALQDIVRQCQSALVGTIAPQWARNGLASPPFSMTPL